jgi:hypothetical protein
MRKTHMISAAWSIPNLPYGPDMIATHCKPLEQGFIANRLNNSLSLDGRMGTVTSGWSMEVIRPTGPRDRYPRNPFPGSSSPET